MIAVAKNPGSIDTTLIPNGSTYVASASLTALIADFDAEYIDVYGVPGSLPESELTSTITPERCERIAGSTALLQRIGPQKLVSIKP